MKFLHNWRSQPQRQSSDWWLIYDQDLDQKKTFSRRMSFCFYCLSYVFLSYDPYGPARNFLGKPYEKKVRYEGRTPRSSRAGKSRTALLEKRTAPLLPQDDGIGTSWFHRKQRMSSMFIKTLLSRKRCSLQAQKLKQNEFNLGKWWRNTPDNNNKIELKAVENWNNIIGQRHILVWSHDKHWRKNANAK